MMKHHIEVTYYNTDDGIWLHCSCGWEKNCGFFPTPQVLMVAQLDHLDTVGATNDLMPNGL